MIAIDYKVMDDNNLSYLFTKGDNDAFVVLSERYSKRLENNLVRLGANRTQVEDIVQQAYLNALKGRSSFKRDASFYSWICRIAQNLWFRQNQRDSRKVGLEFEVEVSSNPEKIASSNELTALIYEQINSLSREDSYLLKQYFLNDVKAKEIAEQLSISEGAVRIRAYRIRERLRRKLEKSCFT